MKRFLIIAIGLILSACCSSRPNFYQTVATNSYDKVFHNVTDVVYVNQITLPNIISRPQIVTLGKEDYEVNIDEFNRWASGLDKMFQNTVNENLSYLLPNARIEKPSFSNKDNKYIVMIDVLEMNGRLKDRATLKALYSIKNKNNKVVKNAIFNETIKINERYNEYIPALNSLIGSLSLNIAKGIAEL